MVLSRLLALALSLCVFDARADRVWLECESFDGLGGWKNDTQFMDQMGSPYLLAHGLGKPVADARKAFSLERGGRYRVWARTKNWTAPWHKGEEGAGRFRLAVNGVELPTELGGQGAGEWLWVMAGEADLKAGRNEVSLRDRDGFDGRCDAIVITNEKDPDFSRPPAPLGSSASFDLCVVGGGIGGICAAVSAARLGLTVALVQDRPVLGGNNSSEVRVHLGAWSNMPPYPRLGDIVAEIGPKNWGNARPAENYEDGRKLAVVRAERNISLFLNERVVSVRTNEVGRLVEATSVGTRTGVRRVYKARWFADCTGDGTLGFLAGADYREGRESKAETGEPSAPDKPDMLTLGTSVQWRAETNEACRARNEACPFPQRPWMLRLDDSNGHAALHGDWDWETGLGRNQIAEAERIRDYGLLVAYSNWAFVKNVSKRKDDFKSVELDWVAYVAGRRESRRLMGDFVLNEKHILERDHQMDGTCAATWTIDLHVPKSAEKTKFIGEPFRAESLNTRIWPCPIPYRCFYSRNVPNLFMAGRDISVTHIALGTTRLMRTIGMMGEVVGMAASVCKQKDCDPRDVSTKHFFDLRELMIKGVGNGSVQPMQSYNIQGSLDPLFRGGYNHQKR